MDFFSHKRLVLPLCVVRLSKEEFSRREAIEKLLKKKNPAMEFRLEESYEAHLIQGWLRTALKETLQYLDGNVMIPTFLNTSAEAINWSLGWHVWKTHCKVGEERYPWENLHPKDFFGGTVAQEWQDYLMEIHGHVQVSDEEAPTMVTKRGASDEHISTLPQSPRQTTVSKQKEPKSPHVFPKKAAPHGKITSGSEPATTIETPRTVPTMLHQPSSSGLTQHPKRPWADLAEEDERIASKRQRQLADKELETELKGITLTDVHGQTVDTWSPAEAGNDGNHVGDG